MKTELRYRFSIIIIVIIYSCCIGCTHSSIVRNTEDKQDTVSVFYKNAKELFTKGADLQKKEKYSEAIAIYKELISLSPQAKLTQTQDGALIIDEGFLQLIYCYIYSEKRKEGVDFLKNIYYENKLWFVQNYPRSVEIYISYGLYEATQIDLAIEFLSRGLKRSAEGRTSEQIYVDNGIASVIYNQVGDLDNAITCGERCVEIIRTMDNKADIVFPLGNLISQYQQKGEFKKALDAYKELIECGEAEKNPHALCSAEENIALLYSEWGMAEEASLHLQKQLAAAYACGLNETRLRSYASIFLEAFASKKNEQAAVYLDSMATYLPKRSQPSFYHDMYDGFQIILELRRLKKTPELLAKTRTLVSKIKQDKLQNIPVMLAARLGEVLAEKQEPQMAIEAYLFCADYAEKNKMIHLQRATYFPLGKLYAQIGNYTAASSAFLKALTADSIFTERYNVGMMMQFEVKTKTSEKEKANDFLQLQLQVKERTIQYYTALGICLHVIALFFIVLLTLRQKRQKERNITVLKSMLFERQTLNRQNAELLEQLNNALLQTDLQPLRQTLSPRLLTNDEEQEFRRQFTRLHPLFLSKLRKACPTITKSEELLSMMIKLNLSSEEIAFGLGNTKSSVNTARFRFRKKLKMNRDSSLEEFLHKL